MKVAKNELLHYLDLETMIKKNIIFSWLLESTLLLYTWYEDFFRKEYQ